MGKNRFTEALLSKKEFIYTLELVPGRGSRGKTQDDILRIAEKAAKSSLFTPSPLLIIEGVTLASPRM
jgi:hypothetical protein